MEKLTGKAVIAMGGRPHGCHQSIARWRRRAGSAVSSHNPVLRGVFAVCRDSWRKSWSICLKPPGITWKWWLEHPEPEFAAPATNRTKNTAKRIFDVCKAHGIHYFFYIGGNDSAETCRIVNTFALAEGYELRVMHIPKTIDNDLRVTDHCPGYGSAAKFVSQAFSGVNLDNRSPPRRIHRCRHGATRGIPHRCVGSRTQISG